MRSQGSRKMIFSSLFTPKWKSKKVAERLVAVSKLDLNKSKENAILNQLAQSDDNEKVRIAALKRINDISLWWKTYKQTTSQSLQNSAEKEIFNQLAQHKPNEDELNILIKRCDKPQQLESLLPLITDFDKKVALLKRIGNKALISDFFISATESQQPLLVPLMQSVQLDKAIVKHAKPALAKQLKEEAEKQQREALKPQQVNQAVTLVLAKLNALRDKFDYIKCADELTVLSTEWQNLELEYLADKEQVEEKHQVILAKVEVHLAALKVKFDELKAQENQKAQIENAKNNALALNKEADGALNTLLSDPTPENLASLNAVIAKMQTELASLKQLSLPTADFQKQLLAIEGQCEEVKAVIDLLPAIASHVNKAKSLTIATDLQTLDAANAEKDEWFNACNEMIKSLPKPLTRNYLNQLRSHDKVWYSAHKALFNEVKLLQAGISKQLKDIKRLIEAGRFKVCFGIFKGVQTSFSELPTSAQQRLEADYQYVEQELTKVNEWQREISLPKRHELIAEVNEKIAEQSDNIEELSTWIKIARKRWNELGYVATDEEKALDEQFNLQLEVAFTPCREHYAALEAVREENVAKRQMLINEYQALLSALPNINLKDIEKQYKKLKQDWRDAGEVDNKRYKQLLASLKPIDNQIFAFIKESHSNNASLKTQLVKDAEACLNNDNIDDVINQLKALQTRWKEIGFAGKNHENQLWNAFREINDKAFSLRDTQKKAEREQQDSQLVAFQNRYTEISNAAVHNDFTSLQTAITQLKSLKAELFDVSLHKTNVAKDINELILQYQNHLEILEKAKSQEKIISLFAALEQGDLPSEWQQKEVSDLSRHQLTIRLELLNELESPEADNALRLTEQVTLLQEKVNGSLHDNESLLNAWLSHGELDEASLKLLARIKPAFI